jgi:hypothetical protein
MIGAAAPRQNALHHFAAVVRAGAFRPTMLGRVYGSYAAAFNHRTQR